MPGAGAARRRRSGPVDVAQYVRKIRPTDRLGDGLEYAILGLFGEVGSLVSVLKKKARDQSAYFGYHSAVVEELGDVLWYLAAVSRREKISLAAVLQSAMDRQTGHRRVFPGAGRQADARRFKAALMDLAAEAGDVVKRFHAGSYRGNRDALKGDLVKLSRPLIRAAAAAGVSLAEAAQANLDKTYALFVEGPYPRLADAGLHIDEQLPRRITMHVYERAVRGKKFVFQKCNGVLIGDRLTDNHRDADDYRFHDVFHLAYASILGWSPVTRALFRVKRKSNPRVDETEDGARAALIEEGLTTWIFEKAKAHRFFAKSDGLSMDLLKAVKDFVRGYEPQDLPLWLWQKAILDGYKVFRQLQKHRQGIVIADLRTRSISFRHHTRRIPKRRTA